MSILAVLGLCPLASIMRIVPQAESTSAIRTPTPYKITMERAEIAKPESTHDPGRDVDFQGPEDTAESSYEMGA